QVESDELDEVLQKIKTRADERCPGVYCMRNPIALTTELTTA
ncbi:MAG: disulfide bond formation regulator, partial [Pseudonocardiales bacterium]